MKTSLLTLFTLSLAAAVLHSQDKYPVRRLTSDPAREGFPSWSPDGKTIIYSFFNVVEGRQLLGSRKVPSDSGTPILFTEYPTEHPQWSPDGRYIIFDADTGACMKIIDADGGSPRKFTPDSITIRRGGLPIWSPTGSHIAFKEDSTSSLCVYDVGTGSVARIFRQEGFIPLPGCWSRDGAGILIALTDRKTRLSTVWRISSDGKERQQITGHRDSLYRYLALSPDGTLLVYAAMQGKRLGLWIMPAEGGKSLPLAVTPMSHNESPAWSPDGKCVAFASGRTGNGDIYLMELDAEKITKELRSLNQ